jgi:N-acetyl-anhydromuramyl-L-alanine amidase AmpD
VPLSPATKQDLIDNISISQVEGISENRFRKTDQPRKIEEVIISDTHGKTAESLIRLFKTDSSGISYHYLIDKQGEIYSMVSEEDIAFHTPKHNSMSISVGLVHVPKQSPIFKDPNGRVKYEEYSDEQMQSLVDLLADIVSRRGLDVKNILPKNAVSRNKITEIGDMIEEIRARVLAKVSKRQ